MTPTRDADGLEAALGELLCDLQVEYSDGGLARVSDVAVENGVRGIIALLSAGVGSGAFAATERAAGRREGLAEAAEICVEYSGEHHGKAERADDPSVVNLLDAHGFAGSNLASSIRARIGEQS